eukprot:m.118094 g.118094  ORF g.118094 m.118094 type:complete len:94 (+) comp13642_c0_seq1:878-1159(+)
MHATFVTCDIELWFETHLRYFIVVSSWFVRAPSKTQRLIHLRSCAVGIHSDVTCGTLLALIFRSFASRSIKVLICVQLCVCCGALECTAKQDS